MGNTTQINLYLKNPDGTPMTSRVVYVKPVRAGFWSNFTGLVEDQELSFKSDDKGYISLTLWPLPYPYCLTYSDDDENVPGHFLFYVPEIDTPVNFDDLVVTKADSKDKYGDQILAQIIAAKVAVLASEASVLKSTSIALGAAQSAETNANSTKSDAASTKSDRDQTAIYFDTVSKLASTLSNLIAKQQAIELQNKLILGNYTLWVDTAGNLRIFKGTPTSDTAGTIVGTQQ